MAVHVVVQFIDTTIVECYLLYFMKSHLFAKSSGYGLPQGGLAIFNNV